MCCRASPARSGHAALTQHTDRQHNQHRDKHNEKVVPIHAERQDAAVRDALQRKIPSPCGGTWKPLRAGRSRGRTARPRTPAGRCAGCAARGRARHPVRRAGRPVTRWVSGAVRPASRMSAKWLQAEKDILPSLRRATGPLHSHTVSSAAAPREQRAEVTAQVAARGAGQLFERAGQG